MTDHPTVRRLTSIPRWIERLRRSEIVERVTKDPRSTGRTILGIDPDTAMREVAGWGQATFDVPWGQLSPADRALTYAYFFQLRHLEELTEAFRHLFDHTARPDNPIVLDLGCGPFTGGLAIAGTFGPSIPFEYLGVDHSHVMRDFGEHLAATAATFQEVPRIQRHWAPDIPSIAWNPALSWRPVIVIVSYLLASPTLDPTTYVAQLQTLLSRLSRGRVMLLYTNSPRNEANRRFPAFRAALRDNGFELFADDTGTITIERQTGSRHVTLRYALFYRPQQQTLRLRIN